MEMTYIVIQSLIVLKSTMPILIELKLRGWVVDNRDSSYPRASMKLHANDITFMILYEICRDI